jgi:nitrite reductase/ring-hydroxylating ferredoxin subunit/uncharacterized membrane protein
MRSTARIKSHPIHPILIAFPLAFFIGTLVFDVLAWIYDDAGLWITAYYLEIAGVVGALIAAIPGIIDLYGTVPPKSSARKRGIKHGLINVTATVLFAAIWFYKNKEDISHQLVIAVEAIGVVLLAIGGWLGGTLVYRNQIGVDLRYADAGKWSELHIREGASPFRVASTDELKVNQMKLIHVKGKRIVLGRTEQGYVAFDDHCPHRGGSLAGGAMICGTVQCPWHGSQFDVVNGSVKAGPAKTNIATYTVQEENGSVLLNL